MKNKVRHFDYLLLGVVVLSAFLNLYLLNHAGSNEYYTVAVKSMMKNFHNFFYASFDPAGFITVDKPPVALWIQTLSARIFGLSNFSVVLPEALAGVASVALLYSIVKKKFGRIAAFISGLVLATTPIFVAIVRTNNVDSILIFVLLAAAWALIRAIDKGRMRWLVVSVILVGVGFNVKMLEAFMVLPAVYLYYWIAMKTTWKKRLLHLTIATVILLAVSFSWATAVALVPANDRPYIGSSQTNSVFELAFGYNGVSRLTGQHGQGSRGGADRQRNFAGQQNGALSSQDGGTGVNGAQGSQPQFAQGGTSGFAGRTAQFGNMQAGGMFSTGQAGPLRLFSKALSSQASWLMPFILFGIIGLTVSFLRTRKLTMQSKFAIFWLGWLVPMMAFFSVAGFFHQYYLSLMGPAIGALTGITSSILWKFYREEGEKWTSWLLPAALLATMLFEALILYQNSVSNQWIYLTLSGGLILFTVFAIFRGERWRNNQKYAAAAGLIILLAAPIYWALPATFNQTNSSLPVAGPSLSRYGGNGGNLPQLAALQNRDSGDRFWSAGKTAGQGMTGFSADRISQMRFGFSRGGGMDGQVSKKLLSYLEKHYNGEKFILAVQSAQSAYSIMLNTNYAVMAMGGFQGSDPAVDAVKLAKMAKAGEVKYFLISGGDRMGSNQSVLQWIEKNCSKVPASEWSSGSAQQAGGQALYVYKG
ncbi:glycosyltransferase family 39 protein [Sporolactobacillus putidus]|uniref:Mannosyltransferase n=1 Tax=Sporolactobacillus putidus TaxID=492735 RepID=A0A917RY44_9BACL|nr:glycosyltransferase family 39 protein [Sporolactobacillus putidus]GGL43395.1 mannosyltransferase [Sporolactobacillus putidus]